MKQKNIVVLGGSFNPPTMAHLTLIQMAMDFISAEKGYLVPVSHAYLKRKMVKAQMSQLCLSDDIRLQMLRGMCDGDPRIDIYTGEMNSVFGAAYQSMAMIQSRHPDARIYFVMGADKLKMIDQFAAKNDFLDRFGILVYARS